MKTLTEQKIEKIRKDPNNYRWFDVSINQQLSKTFIREYQDFVDWEYISYNYKLSESFIREFKDRVAWSSISTYQKLSEDFICEFIDKVNIEWILKYQEHLSPKTRNKIKVIHELSK